MAEFPTATTTSTFATTTIQEIATITSSESTQTKTYRGLTTPFVPPNPTCTDIFNTTVLTTSFWWNGDMRKISTLTVLASDAGDPRFSSCMPAGWDPTIQPETARFEFSPAVCPEKWTMYYVRSVGPNLSTGVCCAPGYKYHRPTTVAGIYTSIGCFSDPGATPSSNIWDYQTMFGHGTMVAHNAWRVSWASSDLSTMSPLPPPDLTRWAYDSWPTADESVAATTAAPSPGGDSQPRIKTSSGSRVSLGVFIVLVTVLPGFVLVIGTWVGVDMWKKRKKRIAANIVEDRAAKGKDVERPAAGGDDPEAGGREKGQEAEEVTEMTGALRVGNEPVATHPVTQSRGQTSPTGGEPSSAAPTTIAGAAGTEKGGGLPRYA